MARLSKEVYVKAETLRFRKKLMRIIKLSSLCLLVFLIVVYIILQVIYNEGMFTVTLDSNATLESGIAVYESLNDTTPRRKLEATPVSFMDNISVKWLPADIHGDAEGSHNGQNYIAYSFYVENQGQELLNYWYEFILDDVIKNVDEALRIRIYRNDEFKTYAKGNSLNGDPEKWCGEKNKPCEVFEHLGDEEDIIILEQRKNFNPGDRDKYTIVMWIEGDDPDCVDALIGGELKIHMNITEEHIEAN